MKVIFQDDKGNVLWDKHERKDIPLVGDYIFLDDKWYIVEIRTWILTPIVLLTIWLYERED